MSVTNKNRPVERSASPGRKKRRFQSPEKKFQFFLEAQRAEPPGESCCTEKGSTRLTCQGSSASARISATCSPATGVFLYLYLLLDEFSRKTIDWLISWHQPAEEAGQLFESRLLSENILALPELGQSEIVNNRGRQMKAHSRNAVLELHGILQLFARSRTPNINPVVESAFTSAKTLSGLPTTIP